MTAVMHTVHRRSLERGASTNTVKAVAYSLLLQLAAPTIEQYWTDLFFDAVWVDKNVDKPVTFHYLLCRWGTTVGLPDLVTFRPGCQLWQIDVERDGDDEWTVTATLVRDEGPRNPNRNPEGDQP